MPNLTDLLKINTVDHLFLYKMRSIESREDLLAEIQTNTLDKVEMLIRLSNDNKRLEEACRSHLLDEHWSTVYDGFVIALTKEKQSEELYIYSHPDIPLFDLMRGIYFFYHSQQIRKESNDPASELSLLKHAMRFSSIQAMQRYHERLYQELVDHPGPAPELFREIIRNCVTMLDFYGSYAYIMLTEAYCRHALYLSQNNQVPEANAQYQAALIACDQAERYLGVSEPSIYNASFGEGLKASNTFGLETVTEIKQYLLDNKSRLLFQTSPAVELFPTDEPAEISSAPRM